MEIWETIGFWHYPIPGFFLLAQFCLGVLVAVGNLVNNSVFLYFSDDDGRSRHDDHTVEGDSKSRVQFFQSWIIFVCFHRQVYAAGFSFLAKILLSDKKKA